MKNFKLNFLIMFGLYIVILPYRSIYAQDAYADEWESVQENSADNYEEDIEKTEDQDVKKSYHLSPNQNKEAEQLRIASSSHVRRFHEVLDELLAEFGYDVKMGQLKGLKNLAIRKSNVNEALPNSYREYLELLIEERIRENSRIRLINCIACKTKTSQLIDGKLIITSPQTNVAQMKRAAEQLGIDNFMDILLVYHTTHMVLALQIFNTSTDELVWTRTYNSETIKSRYQKLAIDYSQVEKSRPGEDYKGDYKYIIGAGGGIIPNVNDNTDDDSMLALHFRGTERFEHRKREFGLLLSIYLRKTSFITNYATEGGSQGTTTETTTTSSTPTPKPFTLGFGVYGLFVHNFIGALESYNQIRHGVNAGIGVFFAPSYLAGTVRAGWDIYFGRRFATNIGLIYVLPSKILMNNEFKSVSGGIGGELVLSLNI